MSMTMPSVDFTFRQDIVGIGKRNVRSALRETAPNWSQEIDRTNLSQSRRDPSQQLRDLRFRNRYSRAGRSTLKLVDAHEVFMCRFGPSLLSDIKRSATSVKYSEAFT